LQDNGAWACDFWGIGMRPKERTKTPQNDLFRLKLAKLIDLRHELCRLGERINWQGLVDQFAALYSEHGHPGVPIRLMAGLHYLKHAFGLSDEAVVKGWLENPYWQYFCGEEYFQHRLPIDPSLMTRFRSRLGPSGCEKLLELTITAGLATQVVKPASFKQVTVDTTVQEKAIAFPTDGRLYHKGRVWLVRLAKHSGIELRQSYVRKGKQALFMQQPLLRPPVRTLSKRKRSAHADSGIGAFAVQAQAERCDFLHRGGKFDNPFSMCGGPGLPSKPALQADLPPDSIQGEDSEQER
jgi:hypothetical protein